MSLENISYVASIVSALVGIFGLFGLGMLVYKIVFKQEQNNNVTVHGDFNGDVINKGTITTSNVSKTPRNE